MSTQINDFRGIHISPPPPIPQEWEHYPTAHHPTPHEASGPWSTPHPIPGPNQAYVFPAVQVPIQERWPRVAVWGHPLPDLEGPRGTLLNINGAFFFRPDGPNPTTMAHVPSPGSPSIKKTHRNKKSRASPPRSAEKPQDSPPSMEYLSPAAHAPNPCLGHTPIENRRQTEPVVSPNPTAECPQCDELNHEAIMPVTTTTKTTTTTPTTITTTTTKTKATAMTATATRPPIRRRR
uniref:Uncharacterized protein n=1 Tax=Photinus pyralis TaxID=7054 RepID=A0A1Y1L011_PHOPY